MEKLSRRKLFTQVSVGAGAAGVLAVAAACAPSSASTQTAELPASTPATDNLLAVFVTDPDKGTLVVMKGEKEVTVTNASLAQNLSQLA
jgi:hypothetical protein